MTYEIYRYIFIGGTILTAIMFVVTALVFIFLKIPAVIGDLTGLTARKAIEDIRLHNESTGEKTYRTSHVNMERGKITDKISSSGRLIKNPSHSLHGAMETEKISTQKFFGTENQTTILKTGGNETTVLPQQNETTVLSDLNQTTVLDLYVGSSFVVEYEITYLHTEEIIPCG